MFPRLHRVMRRLMPRTLAPHTAPVLTFDDYVGERVGVWNAAPPLLGALIFLGDSQIERGFWSEWWRGDILNRGIGGQTTGGVRERLDEVVRHQPRLVVLECGTNDLAALIPVEEVAASYEALLDELRTRLPHAVLWPQSVLPVHQNKWRKLAPKISARNAEILNARIGELNALLAQNAAKRGLSFHDATPDLSDDSALKSSCTLDGTHLNGEGYGVWRAAMKRGAPPEIAALLGELRG